MRVQAPHGQELDDAVLDLLDVVVVGVEHLARVVQVEVVLGALPHGSDAIHSSQVRMTPCSAACGGSVLQALELAVDLAADLLGQRDLLEALAQLAGLRGGLVELAELAPDRLELLAQDELALALVDLGLDLGLDLRPDRDDLELAGEDLGQPPQAAGDVDLLQELLLLLGREPQRPGDEVAQRARVVDVGDRELELLGQVGQVLDDRAEGLPDVARQRLELGRALGLGVGQLLDLGHEVGRLARPLPDPHPLGALDEDAQGPVRDLEHARDRADDADVVQLLGAGDLDRGVLRGDHDQHAVAGQHVVDELDRALLADRQRRERVRQGHGLAQRQDGQRGREEPLAADLDVAPVVAGVDVDHEAPPPRAISPSPSSRATSIGTVRASARCSGSSTRRIPSR